jgi:molybdate transport system ATP-binding protein
MSLQVTLRATAGSFRLDLSFQAGAGVTALFGPSGAGKSLTLRHIAGLERAHEGLIDLGGRVLFDSESKIHVRSRERKIGLVFQEYALFPHLDVAGNISYGLHGRSRSERARRVNELLELTGLAGNESRRPNRLSGGERQRVALARALAPEPDLLLLDEPFAALDFRVRRGLRDELRSLHRRTGVPMILVTHSLDDVRALSDELVLIDAGRVVAAGRTSELLASPPSGEARALVSETDLR